MTQLFMQACVLCLPWPRFISIQFNSMALLAWETCVNIAKASEVDNNNNISTSTVPNLTNGWRPFPNPWVNLLLPALVSSGNVEIEGERLNRWSEIQANNVVPGDTVKDRSVSSL